MDPVDALRQREAEAWKRLLETGSVEDLLAHQSALRALNGEVEDRITAMIGAGRIRTSGRKAVGS